MSRGVDRQPIFFDVDDRRSFGELLRVVSERFTIEIHAYCLMTNHLHLLVRCPEGGLSHAMQWLLSAHATRLNTRHGRAGHLFGGRFTSRQVSDADYLANVVRYIHLNPMDISGVESPTEYRWSSHRTYLGLRPTPDWFHIGTVASWFESRAAFDRFVCAPLHSRPLHGSSPSDANKLIEAVDFVIAERSGVRGRGRGAQRRAVAFLMADTASARLAEDLELALGIESGGARRSARYRARALATDPEVASLAAAAQLLLAAGPETRASPSAA